MSKEALAIALVSVTVTRLSVTQSTLVTTVGQNLEVAPDVVLHVTDLIYTLATEATDQHLHHASCQCICGH